MSSGCSGEASGATHLLSLLTPLILLRVIRGWNWSHHCARPGPVRASLPHTLLSLCPQRRKFGNAAPPKTRLFCDNDNEHRNRGRGCVDTTVQPVDFDPVAMRQHSGTCECYFVSKKDFLPTAWAEIIPWKWRLCDVSPPLPLWWKASKWTDTFRRLLLTPCLAVGHMLGISRRGRPGPRRARDGFGNRGKSEVRADKGKRAAAAPFVPGR